MASPAFEDIAETFAFLDDWEDRYRHVIELGRAMPELDAAFRVPATKVDGCASQVWIVPRIEGAGAGATLTPTLTGGTAPYTLTDHLTGVSFAAAQWGAIPPARYLFTATDAGGCVTLATWPAILPYAGCD